MRALFLIIGFGFLFLFSMNSSANDKVLFNRIWDYSPLQTYTNPDGKVISVKSMQRTVWFEKIPMTVTTATLVELNNVGGQGDYKELEHNLKNSFPEIPTWKVKKQKGFIEFEGDWDAANKNVRLLYYLKNKHSIAVTAISNNTFKKFHHKDVDVLFEVFKQYYDMKKQSVSLLDKIELFMTPAYAQSLGDLLGQYTGGGTGTGGTGTGTGGSGTGTGTGGLGNIVTGGNTTTGTGDPSGMNQYLGLNTNSNVNVNITTDQNTVIASQNYAAAGTQMNEASVNINSAAGQFNQGMASGVVASQNGVIASQNVKDAAQISSDGAITSSNNILNAANVTQQSTIIAVDGSKETATIAGDKAIQATQIAVQGSKDTATIIGDKSIQATQIATDGAKATATIIGDKTVQATQIASDGMQATAKIGADAIKYSADKAFEMEKYLLNPKVVAEAAFAGAAGAALGGLAVTLAKEGVVAVLQLIAHGLSKEKEIANWNAFKESVANWRGKSDEFVASVRNDYSKMLPTAQLLDDVGDAALTPEDIGNHIKDTIYKLQAELDRQDQMLKSSQDDLLRADGADGVITCRAQLYKNKAGLTDQIAALKENLSVLGRVDSKQSLRKNFCTKIENYKAGLNDAMINMQKNRERIMSNREDALKMTMLEEQKDSNSGDAAKRGMKHADDEFFSDYKKMEKTYNKRIHDCFKDLEVSKRALIQRIDPDKQSEVYVIFRNVCAAQIKNEVTKNLYKRNVAGKNEDTFDKTPYVYRMLDISNAADEAQAEQICAKKLSVKYPLEGGDYPRPDATTKQLDLSKVPECQDPIARNAVDMFVKFRQMGDLQRREKCAGY